ncbi:MAG: hypothetical protein Q7Q71_01115 [Verrucomicrobiota bacterium JB023]|nr:hypothetical protein [Verrucomicrobiota bacterium JB023]
MRNVPRGVIAERRIDPSQFLRHLFPSVQVPYKVAIPLIILLPILVWLLGTRQYDFVTPPPTPSGETEMPAFAAPVSPEVLASLNRRPVTEIPPEPEPPRIPTIEPGDFMVSPGIDEYRDAADKGPAALLALAKTLLEQGQPLRALLAFERIIDSTPPGGPERLEAAPQLPALRDQLPPWNADPTAARQFILHLRTARSPEEMESHLTKTREMLTISSGHQVDLQIDLQPTPAPLAPVDSLPVTFWISVAGEDVRIPSLPISTFSGVEEEEFETNLIRALYEQLALRLRNLPELTPPPPFPEEGDPALHFSQAFTLLIWDQILKTPFQNFDPEGLPGSEPLEEPEKEAPESGESEISPEIDDFDQDNFQEES